MADVKKFDADAKFGDVKKYQEVIEVLLIGIDNEVCVLVHQLTFIMSQAYGTRAPSSGKNMRKIHTIFGMKWCKNGMKFSSFTPYGMNFSHVFS